MVLVLFWLKGSVCHSNYTLCHTALISRNSCFLLYLVRISRCYMLVVQVHPMVKKPFWKLEILREPPPRYIWNLYVMFPDIPYTCTCVIYSIFFIILFATSLGTLVQTCHPDFGGVLHSVDKVPVFFFLPVMPNDFCQWLLYSFVDNAVNDNIIVLIHTVNVFF